MTSPKDLETALQYSATSGLPALASILHNMQVVEHAVPADRAEQLKVCITTGSQDALTKCFEMLMEEGDSVLVESPTYSGSLAYLQPTGTPLVRVGCDEGRL